MKYTLKIRIHRLIIITVVTLLLLILFRNPLLKATGQFLIYESELKKSEVIFVLSGGGFDRGNEAVKLYEAGWARKIVCTGENIPTIFYAVDLAYPESEVTWRNITRQGVPEEAVELVIEGTSTKEEVDLIIDYCTSNKIKRIIILSSKFHTRRIQREIFPPFEGTDIEVLLHGAPSSLFNEMAWWENEHGLINLNNEYIKLFYYWVKY